MQTKDNLKYRTEQKYVWLPQVMSTVHSWEQKPQEVQLNQ